MIFKLLGYIEDDVSIDYQNWRDQNPDNPSDDDFYEDTGRDDQETEDSDQDQRSGWVKLW